MDAFEKSIYLLLGILVVTSFFTNFSRLNFHNIYIGDNYAIDLLKDLPKDSVAFLTGDTRVFNSYYMQNAYDLRGDIYIPGRPDSFRGLLKYSSMSDSEIEDYILKRGGTIDKETYIKILPTLVLNKEVYADHQLNFQIAYEDYGKIIFVPWGLTKKLFFEKTYNVSKEEYIEKMKQITDGYQLEELTSNKEIIDYNVNYADIQMSYASSYYSIADFIATYYNDPTSAKYFLEKSLDLDPLKST